MSKNYFVKIQLILRIYHYLLIGKTGHLYIYKIDELFADKVPNVLIPFIGMIETKDYLLKGSSGISSGIFRVDFIRTFLIMENEIDIFTK